MVSLLTKQKRSLKNCCKQLFSAQKMPSFVTGKGLLKRQTQRRGVAAPNPPSFIIVK